MPPPNLQTHLHHLNPLFSQSFDGGLAQIAGYPAQGVKPRQLRPLQYVLYEIPALLACGAEYGEEGGHGWGEGGDGIFLGVGRRGEGQNG